jgi:RNA 2',3'-cyclic 3'-phosphodiesterase
MIRAFVAIRMPEDVAAALLAAQAGLPAGRPVERDNLHLTLAFLGERREPDLEDVHYALEAIRGPQFALSLTGLGLFEQARGIVVFAGVAPEPALSRLRDKVCQAARGAGIALERGRYRPHVTLARVNRAAGIEEVMRLRASVARGSTWRAGPFDVRGFALLRSRLGRGGPSYEDLACYPLGVA